MAGIPAGVSKVVVHATTDSSAEIAEWGFWIGYTPTSPTNANDSAAAIASAFQAHYGAIKALMSTDSTYDEIRLYGYPTGGPTATYVGAAPVTGGAGSGSGSGPLQQAMVMTLRTGLAGRSHRGRMYLPAFGLNLSGHIFASTPTSDAVEAVAAFLSAVNDAFPGGPVCVVSQTLSTATAVTSVDADYRADVQRRRANRQPTGGRSSATL